MGACVQEPREAGFTSTRMWTFSWMWLWNKSLSCCLGNGVIVFKGFHCRSGLSLEFSTQRQLFRCPIQLSFRGKWWIWAKGQCTKFCQPEFSVYLHFNFQVSVSFISPRGNMVIYIPLYSILGVFCSLWAMKAARFYNSRTCPEGILWSWSFLVDVAP